MTPSSPSRSRRRFDSIQFVRDYLQRTIEGKLRDLMMDELPAIIHRLSLQLCDNT